MSVADEDEADDAEVDDDDDKVKVAEVYMCRTRIGRF